MLLSAVGAASCTRPATQLVVVVDSDVPSTELGEVHVLVQPLDGPAGDAPAEMTFDLGEASLAIPFSFGIVPPGGDSRRRVEVIVEGRVVRGDVRSAIVRRVRTGFLAGHALQLPIFLADACAGVTCDAAAELSCDRGECVSIDVATDSLAPARPGLETMDTGDIDAALDAGPPEAGTDRDAPRIDADQGDGGVGCPSAPVAIAVSPEPALVALVSWPERDEFAVAFHTGTGLSMYTLGRDGSLSTERRLSVAPEPLDGIALAPVDGTDALLLVSEPGVSQALLYRSSVLSAMSPMATLDGHVSTGGVSAPLGGGFAFLLRDASDAPIAVEVLEASGVTRRRHPLAMIDPLDAWLAPLADGRAVLAAPASAGESRCSVFTIDAGGTSLGPLPVDGTSDCASPTIAGLSDGRVVLAWSDGTGARYGTLSSPIEAPLSVMPLALGGAPPGRTLVLPDARGNYALVFETVMTSLSVVPIGTDGIPEPGRRGSVSTAGLDGALTGTRAARLDDHIAMVVGYGGTGHVVIAHHCLPPP